MRRESPQILGRFREAMKAAEVDKRDVAALALARRYAQLIDDAATDMDAAIDRGAPGQEKAQLRALERQTLSDLGPKLLAAMTALGLTASGRSTPAQAPRKEVKRDAPVDQLASLRQRAAARRAR